MINVQCSDAKCLRRLELFGLQPHEEYRLHLNREELKRQCSLRYSSCYSSISLEGLRDSTKKKADSFRSLRNGIYTCPPAELVTSRVLRVSLQQTSNTVPHSFHCIIQRSCPLHDFRIPLFSGMVCSVDW